MYFAVDLLLWSNIGKHEVAKSKLLGALHSDISSSFRIVTGGMLGVDSQPAETGPQMTRASICERNIEQTPDTCEEKTEETPGVERRASSDPELIDLILSIFVGLILKRNSWPVIAVV